MTKEQFMDWLKEIGWSFEYDTVKRDNFKEIESNINAARILKQNTKNNKNKKIYDKYIQIATNYLRQQKLKQYD
jgi:uncharacterized membrane-anchored protein YjiN (DUF445 family)